MYYDLYFNFGLIFPSLIYAYFNDFNFVYHFDIKLIKVIYFYEGKINLIQINEFKSILYTYKIRVLFI